MTTHPAAPSGPSAPTARGRGTASFTIAVPRNVASAGNRRALYVSPNAGSLQIVVLNADGSAPSPAIPPTVVALSSSTTGCAASAPSAPNSLVCTVNVAVPAGTWQFGLSVYQSADASGPALGMATVNATIASAQPNAVAVTLGGVINTLAFNPARLVAPADGTAHALATNVTAMDASGAVIIAPGSFYTGITLAVSNDPNGALSLPSSTIGAPTATGPSAVSVNYDATKALTSGTVTASVAGGPSATASVTPLVYSISSSSIGAGNAPATLTVSEAGSTGPFTVAANPAAALQLTPPSATAASAGASVSFSVSAGSQTGPATITVSDGTVSGTVSVTVTSAQPTVTEWNVAANSYPNSIVGGPDNNLWFTEIGAGKIGAFSTAGTLLHEYAVSLAPARITVGPDGNLWFTEFDGSTHDSKIGKLTTAGVLTEYAVPTAGAHALGIAAGPDGNLWFTEEDQNKVAKITTAGVITEYTGMTSPRDLVAGSDGNLWFTEYNYRTTNPSPQKMGKITTAGVVSEYTLGPDSTVQPAGIWAGPDGNLWFTEFDPNGTVNTVAIGKITTGGASTLYSTGLTGGAQPDTIRTGPDGNLWFTENTLNKIGRITTAGSISEYTPTGLTGDPLGLTLGSDHKLWFTEFAASAIGNLTP